MPTKPKDPPQLVAPLSSAERALAVFGCGLVDDWRRHPASAIDALRKLLGAIEPDSVLTWKLAKAPADSWLRQPVAREMAGVVLDALANRPIRVGIELGRGAAGLPVWASIVDELSAYRVAWHVAVAADRECRFRWPMRIGFLPGEPGERSAQHLTAMDEWHGRVYRAETLSRRATDCELLVLRCRLGDARASLVEARRSLGRIRADIVAVFDCELSATSVQHASMLDQARSIAGAGAAVLFPVGSMEPVERVRSVCVEISHNHPLDVALAIATGGSALLLADAQLLAETSLESKALKLARLVAHPSQASLPIDGDRFGRWARPADRGELEEAGADDAAPPATSPAASPPPAPPAPPAVDAEPSGDEGESDSGAGYGIGRGAGGRAPRRAARRPGGAARRPGLARPRITVPQGPNRARLAQNIASGYREFGWMSEGGEASDLGNVILALADDDERMAGPRYLQAGFSDTDDPARPIAALRPGSRYLVNVFVDQARAGFVHGDAPFPDLPPPDDGRAHELEVVFWEPKLCRKPLTGRIELPPIGGSSVCSFPLRTRAATRAVNARITILHRNRVLQTGRLTAPVGGDGQIGFELDAVPRRLLNGLDERTQFSLAMVLNDVEGEGAVHFVQDGAATTLMLGAREIDALVDAVGGAISLIADDPPAYEGLAKPKSQELLRRLAQKGALLREYLERYVLDGKLESPEYVQVVRTKPGELFPLEFIYADPLPKATATLCAHAEEALAHGGCLATCARHVDPSSMKDTVCPFGFWGLKCVIERRGNSGRADRAARGLPVEPPGQSEPLSGSRQVLHPLSSVLVGATPKADTVVPGAIDGMIARITQLCPGTDRVDLWAKWPEAVARTKPATLALLVHQEKDALGTPQIEIGAPPMLSSDDLQDEHVHPPGTGAPPVVLLIGCETGRATLSYENFALRFQWRGAAIVVSTIASVLGRQAAPMTAEILEAIRAVDTPTSFAVVMRDLRRRLLAKGTPMVLSLIADGDADWDIVGR